MRIFVYEPEESLAILFQYYLEEIGHNVQVSFKEKEALAIASASSFDLYVLNHSRFDPIEIFIPIIPQNKILVLSTADQEVIERDLINFHVLSKPFEFKDFEAAILTFAV